ncbi:MAG: aminotransferase class III-fold pyridoxal phosphate-dependent enzyme, partial [Leptolyngbyaceae cyanobacterium CRU_2_3]|nr:aminotransferase class III-fold pyridoxal phosphate-dependent enzyme [Leptolyngbyaceae cyanobacterium CRU_2_3]
YSGHPVACAASLATLDIYEKEDLFQRAHALANYWEHAVHSLRGLPHVIDTRNLGLVAGIELESIPGKPSARAFDCFLRCYERGLLIRTTGDIIALSPPLIIEKPQIDQLFGMLADILKELP